MTKTKTKPQATVPQPVGNGFAGEVLTLAEMATYLRLPEDKVLEMIRKQNLPARRVGTEWRFLKTAVQQWLSQPLTKSKPGGIWAAAGSWNNDPYLDNMLKEIYRRRGRTMTEED